MTSTLRKPFLRKVVLNVLNAHATLDQYPVSVTLNRPVQIVRVYALLVVFSDQSSFRFIQTLPSNIFKRSCLTKGTQFRQFLITQLSHHFTNDKGIVNFNFSQKSSDCVTHCIDIFTRKECAVVPVVYIDNLSYIGCDGQPNALRNEARFISKANKVYSRHKLLRVFHPPEEFLQRLESPDTFATESENKSSVEPSDGASDGNSSGSENDFSTQRTNGLLLKDGIIPKEQLAYLQEDEECIDHAQELEIAVAF
ncbi:uncharacterized protein V1510DRAFT_407830 [Dipodascopsis tothii]|uniref:uncharacterized protein n=1 Tax=Dipodascopsis tothii TaxID=44089 RepID=UPI0034CDFE87